MKVDAIFHSGHVYTIDSVFSIQEAFVVHEGKIVATGSNKEILSKYSSDDKINLDGDYVYPGFIDPHCHFLGFAKNHAWADFRGLESAEAVVKELLIHRERFPDETFLLGRGWDQNLWPEKEFPSRDILDKAFPDVPVYLVRIDGHAAWVNTAAMQVAGIQSDIKVDGGKILLTEKGELQGILLDNAMDLIRDSIPAPGFEQLVSLIMAAQRECIAVGLTSLGEAGLDHEDINLLDSLNKNGSLYLRIYAMLNPSQDNFEKYMYPGPYKTDYLSVRSIKLYADGALGSRGACLLEPYTDMPDTYGFLTENEQVMKNHCLQALNYGFQVNTHAIGDSANRLMLKIYAELLAEKNDKRWRIEHAQVIHEEDFDLFGRYSIVPSIQTTHASSDMNWAGKRLGEKRLKNAYAYQRLLQQNGWLPNGSDFPIEEINPLNGFYAAVARQDYKGFPEEGFQMENALSRQEALKAMTIWAAKSAFEENEKGSLETGKHADFVILDVDLMEVPLKHIPEIQVKETYISGKKR